MNRSRQSSASERLAVSFPIAVAAAGLIGWVAQSWISNSKTNSGNSRGANMP